MNCIWISKTELSISLGKQCCERLGAQLKKKEEYEVDGVPQGKISIDLGLVSTEFCLKAFKEVKCRALLVDPTVSSKDISFVRTLSILSWEKGGEGVAEQILDDDSMALIVSPHDMKRFYLGLKHFCQGYWWFFIEFESLSLTVTFSSHGDEDNDLEKLEDLRLMDVGDFALPPNK